MSFIARLQRAREILEQQGRLSTRALERELGIGGDELEEIVEELVDVQQVARREGRILVWNGPAATPGGVTDPRAPRPTAEEAVARKVVTVVFADLIGSTSLHERLDAESARGLMDRYYRVLRTAVEGHGGRVVKLLGDGVMAAFGVPRVAEDDAIRAVRAAVGMQQAFREHVAASAGAPVGLRVAVNTGEVVVSADQSDVVGDPVNVAARLQQEAVDGDVLLGDATQRLVRELVTLAPAGVFSLKGRAEPVRAYRVVSLDRPAGSAATAFVGRDEELARVRVVYDAALAAPGVRLAVVLGSPGLGKSRLLAEFGRRLGDAATVLTARCDAAGGATFAPLAEALRAYLRVEGGGRDDGLGAAIDAAVSGLEADRTRIAGGIGALLAGTPAAPEETFFVVRRFLGALAATRPVVLAVDDLQWAEPLLLDLVEHLVQWGTGVRLLVLAAARPDLRDLRSSLAQPGGLVGDVVMLAGLDAAAATRLAANVIGADALPAAVAGRVLATSEGNPLFVGELVRMLVNDGALRQEGDRWTTAVELATLEMPPTIHALLAARIERLGAEERTVLERAAVIGRQFSRSAVAHLLPGELRAQLDARLEALRRSELIEPDTTWFLGEPALRFHHGLTRDAAYRRVLKGTRAELHARVADWIVERVGEAIEHDETIGWHLEQAHQHLRELGPLDAQGRALGERAARRLGAAGRRALARDDLPVAGNLLGRAIGLLGATDPGRADLALEWCEALLAAGDVGPAAEAIAELGQLVEGSGATRLRAWHACFAGEHAALTDPQTLRATADAVAAAAETLASVGDAAGEAKAHFVHALALARLGRVGASEAALDLALTAARRAHDRRRVNAVLAGAPLAALWGPSPVARASGRCLDVVRVLRITQGAPAVEAVALRCQAVLEALRGRAEAARRMIASSRRMVEELGLTQGVLETEWFAGVIALFEGDAAEAERRLRAAYEGFRHHGLGIDAARAAALLGIALLVQGRPSEAEALSHESEALAGDDLQAAITWRRVRAEALARRGEHAAAVDFARAAVEIAAATDGLLHHADARLAFAAALRAAGRYDQAVAEEARAIELWEAKGATVLAELARRGLGRVVPAAQGGETPRAAVRRVQRRVRTNAVSAALERLEAAFRARDLGAVEALCGDYMEIIDHPTGATYGREGQIESSRRTMRMPGLELRIETLATLGESLALCRRLVTASGTAGGDFDVGAYEMEHIVVCELDEMGRFGRFEAFAPDRLGAAVVRLYERYAELLPEGPERRRAAATARSVAAVPGPLDFDRIAATMGPDVEFVDHRPLGLPASRGREAYLRALRSLLDVADEVTNRVDDVLALRPEGYLLRFMNFGTERTGGGAFERPVLLLLVFDADGLAAHFEFFAPDREAEGLARFEELTARASPVRLPPPSRSARRVRPNAATANAAAFAAAIVARDVATVAAHVTGAGEVVEHDSHVTYDRERSLSSWLSLAKAEGAQYRIEPLATLGDSLAVFRQWIAGSSAVGRKFDVGAYEMERVMLIEVEGEARRRANEGFGPDRLGEAIVRLYERYAELLPPGPERSRAAAAARAFATQIGQLEIDRFFSRMAPSVEYVDHRRMIGLGVLRGVQAFREALRTLLEAADDVTNRVDDVLALHPGALLVRMTNFGTERAAGGAYERHFLAFWILGANGLIAHVEQFDVGDEVEALARFDACTAGPPERCVQRRVRPNAATATAARADAALAAGDIDAFLGFWAENSEIVDHPTGTVYDRSGLGTTWRRALRRVPNLTLRSEELATLGDSLGLFRQWVSGSASAGGKFDVGAYEMEHVFLNEVDAQGRFRHSERFAVGRLGDALLRLYERYAELLPEGPERSRIAASAHALATQLGPLTFERFVSAVSPAIEYVDHRRLIGAGTIRGAQAFRAAFRALFDVAADMTNRLDDVLAMRADAILVRVTNMGTERIGGGRFERPLLAISVFGADGIARVEAFDAEREAEALARFDDLTAERVPARAVHRRVRANAATAMGARLDAALAACDADALPSLVADNVELVDHTTGVAYGRQGTLATWRSTLKAHGSTQRYEPLASLGDSLALFRWSMSARGIVGGSFDVGAYENEHLPLLEVDAEGRMRRGEVFAGGRLGDAVVRLYERYAELLDDGPARARAAATARGVATRLGPFDPERYAASFAPDVEAVDHRTLGTWSARGADELMNHFRALVDLVEGATVRAEDVLGLRADALLVRIMNSGTDRAGGGVYERPFLLVMVFGADGHTIRMEWFDVGHEAEALARFDALAPNGAKAPAPPAVRIENAATRTMDSVVEAWKARDWEGYAARLAPGFRCFDRRKLMHVELDRSQYLDSYRLFFDMRSSLVRNEVVATRGQRLAIARIGWEGADDLVGPSDLEWLQLIEVDDAGRRVAIVNFDVGDVDGAYAELDERYAAGEAALEPAGRHTVPFVRALVARDWEQVAAAFAPDFVLEDRRPLRLLPSLSGTEYVASVRALLDLRPDATFRLQHVLASDERALTVGGWTGGEPDGTFEIPVVNVVAAGAEGIRRWHFYNLDQLDEARACYEKLAAPAPPRIENAATRTADRVVETWETRDWEGYAALFAPGFRCVDRRKKAQLELDRNQYLESYRSFFHMRSSAPRNAVLATRGRRLALIRVGWEGADDLVGPSELEWLMLIEVDEGGRRVAVVNFDSEDVDAVYAELDRRYLAGEAASCARVVESLQRGIRALTMRDWEQVLAAFAPGYVLEDHRPMGLLTSLSGEGYVASARALVDLRPDAIYRLDHVLAVDDRRALVVAGWRGGAPEGAFEIPAVLVFVLGPDAAIRRGDLYNPDQLDEAWACFDAVGASAGRKAGATRDPLVAPAKPNAALPADPLRIPPNAATRAGDRLVECSAARDWPAHAALFAPTVVFDDRRRLLRTTGDRDMAIASSRITSLGGSASRTRLATAGQRLGLERVRFGGGDVGSEWEVDTLHLVEVDAEGRIVALIIFDPDARRAASAEMLERYARSDEMRDVPPEMFRAWRALNAHDLDGLRAALPRDYVYEDHRRTGVGRLESAEAYLASIAPMFELAPDAILENLYTIATERHGTLAMTHSFGTLAGGGEFESVYVVLTRHEGGRLVGLEMFEPEDLPVARARFEALRPDPLRIPPNAATRALGRWFEHGLARNWAALESLFAPTLALDDRRRLVRTTGGRDMAIASTREVVSLGVRPPSRTLLGTAGDRLALERVLFISGDAGSEWEVDSLHLVEIDAVGRIIAVVVFDPDDHRAASAEMLERYARNEAARDVPAAFFEGFRAYGAQDLERIRVAMSDPFVVEDRRRTGAGRLERVEDHVAFAAALGALAPGSMLELLYVIAAERHGLLAMARGSGTLADGGEFEINFVLMARFQGDRVVGLELFEPEHLDAARARFEALRTPKALGPSPSCGSGR
jgi:class 3 adenylate cyclase/tetratricopeptide (TPR) repeat protein